MDIQTKLMEVRNELNHYAKIINDTTAEDASGCHRLTTYDYSSNGKYQVAITNGIIAGIVKM